MLFLYKFCPYLKYFDLILLFKFVRMFLEYARFVVVLNICVNCCNNRYPDGENKPLHFCEF